MDFRQLIIDEANRQGVDPTLALSVAQAESSLNPNAVSPKGARGIFQLMPATAKELGVDPNDPAQNIRGGLTYLKQQMDRFQDPRLALAAYNAGPGNVQKYGGVPPFTETQNYVSKILGPQSPPVQVAQAPASTMTDAAPPEAQSISVVDKYSKGFGVALESNDTGAAEFISEDLHNKLRKAVDRAREIKDEGAAKYLETQLQEASAKIYNQAQQTGNHKLAESVRSQARKGGKWTFDAANSDPIWIQNAKTLYKDVNGKDFEGEPAEAADWLKNFMGQYEWNIPAAGITAASVSSWSDQGKVAFLNSLKDYQDLPNFEREAIGRAFKGVVTDPTTYVGIGVGKVLSKLGGKAAQTAIKEAIEKGLEQSIAKRIASSTATKVGTEGAVYSGGSNVIQQAAEVGAGGKEGIDLGEAGLATATGFGVGAGAGKIIDKVTGRTAVENFVRRSGSEANARMDAEIVDRISTLSKDPIRQQYGKQLDTLQTEDLNKAVTDSFIDPVKQALDSLPKNARPDNFAQLKAALSSPKKLSASQREALRGTPYGDAVADAVERAIRSKAITSAIPSKGGITPLLRAGLDMAPLPQALRWGLQNALGRRVSREAVTSGLLKQEQAAGRVLSELGPSAATQSMQDLQAMAQKAVVSDAARKQMAKEATEKAAAESQLTGRQIAEQFNRGQFQEGGVQATFVGRKGLPTDPEQIVKGLAELKGSNKDLAEAIDRISKNERIDIRKLGVIQNELRAWANKNGIPTNAENTFSAVGGVDGFGNRIRNPLAYQAAAEGNQARVTQTLASVAQANLSQEGRAAVANAVTQIGTAKTKAQAKLYLETALQAVSPGEQKEAKRLLEPLMNQIKND